MTDAAWIGKREVVEVTYRPEELPFATLLDHAIANSCDQWIYATTDAQLAAARTKIGDKVERFDGKTRRGKDSDQLYYLSKSPLRFLPLTPTQARRINGALGTGKDPAPWLSPRQLELRKEVDRVLESAPESLRKLTRPTNLDGLADYHAKLVSITKAAPRPLNSAK